MVPLSLPRLFVPLRQRDFALLSLGSTVSLLGDGFFAIALPFQVYQLNGSPIAFSLVSAVRILPSVLLLLVGGLVTDRIDRRHVLFGSDLLRAVITGLIGLLAISGTLQLWHLLLLLPFFGAGTAFFAPASVAILPDLLPQSELPQANAFRGAINPLMALLLGPAIGGLVVGAAGPGPALLFDAGSFLVSATAVLLTHARPRQKTGAPVSALADLRSGWHFVHTHPWCWATLAGASISLLCWNGPVQVLLPYVVKFDLHAGAAGLGLIFAVGGAGSILMAVLVAQLGLPRRAVAVMYVAWAAGIGVMAGYGGMTAIWQGMLIALVANALLTMGQLIWETLFQRLVPGELLGRVSSLDWFVSIGLVPVSMALAGPVAAVIGVRETLVGGGLLGGVAMGLFLLVPGVQNVTRDNAVHTL